MLTTQIKRFEYKYIVNKKDLPKILFFLSRFAKPDLSYADPITKSYVVHSIYFDTPTLKYYFEKIYGIMKRKKFRLRQYHTKTHGKSNIFAEIKYKHGAVITKERIQLEANTIKQQSDMYSIDNAFRHLYIQDTLRPTTLISYTRQPLIGIQHPHIRITIDRDLQSCIPNDFTFTQTNSTLLTDQAIIELKYHTYLPTWVNMFIKIFSLQQTSYSKYCAGLQHIRPTLTK